MYKPVYLLPFIYVYHLVFGFTTFIIELISFSAHGFYVSGKLLIQFLGLLIKNVITIFRLTIKGVIISYDFVSSKLVRLFKLVKCGIIFSATKIVSFFRIIMHGFKVTLIHTKHFVQMIILGIDVYAYYTRRGFEVTYGYIVLKIRQYIAYRKRKKEESHRKRVEKSVQKEKVREEKMRIKAEDFARRHETFIDKNIEFVKKPTFGEKINSFLQELQDLPKKFSKNAINDYLETRKQKKDDFDKEVLDLDLFDEEKGEKTRKQKNESKILYEYVARDKDGKRIKGYFEAFNKMEVKSYLINEGLEVYSIRTNKWITLFHKDTASGNVKFKTHDLVFFLTQLSTYIKAGIPLAESLEILSRQFKNKHYQRIIKGLVYDLNLGVNFSEALEKQGKAFPRLLVNMVRASEMTGDLPEVLDDQAVYFDEMEQSRKQMITAMMYPSIVFILALGVLTFVMLYVVPQFVDIFESLDASAIPGITIFIMNMSEFMKDYIIYIAIGVVIFLLILIYLYKNVTLFRRWSQMFMMHLPVFGNVIIYNEVTTFTKTFSSLMAHNVFITETMAILKKITNNEIYKDLINETIKNLSTGEKISLAFKNHWAFPVPAYEMLVTGERTGELPEMMAKVSAYYQDLHKNAVARIKVFIEPMLIIMLTAMVGLIVLAIVVPMFKMYGAIQAA